jgi:hypothetical protein
MSGSVLPFQLRYVLKTADTKLPQIDNGSAVLSMTAVNTDTGENIQIPLFEYGVEATKGTTSSSSSSSASKAYVGFQVPAFTKVGSYALTASYVEQRAGMVRTGAHRDSNCVKAETVFLRVVPAPPALLKFVSSSGAVSRGSSDASVPTLTQIQLPQSNASLVLEDCHGNTVTNLSSSLDLTFTIVPSTAASLTPPQALPSVAVSPQPLTIGDGTGQFAVDEIQLHGGSGSGVCDMLITVTASGRQADKASSTILPDHMFNSLPPITPLRLTVVFAPAGTSGVDRAAVQRLDRLERIQQSVVVTKDRFSALTEELLAGQKYMQQKEWTMGIAVEDQLANQVTVRAPRAHVCTCCCIVIPLSCFCF